MRNVLTVSLHNATRASLIQKGKNSLKKFLGVSLHLLLLYIQTKRLSPICVQYPPSLTQEYISFFHGSQIYLKYELQ